MLMECAAGADAGCQQRIHAYGATPLLFDALRVVEAGTGALTQLAIQTVCSALCPTRSMRRDALNRTLAASLGDGGIPLLLRVLVHHGGHAETVEGACDTLWSFSRLSDEAARAVIDAAG